MDLATISAALEIDVDPGIFDDWITGLEDPANVQTNDARDLCYALRISDGANIEKILASAVTLPAAAETASVSVPAIPSVVAGHVWLLGGHLVGAAPSV